MTVTNMTPDSDVLQQLDGIRLAFPTTSLSRVACGNDAN